jgi:hypothetical protein
MLPNNHSYRITEMSTAQYPMDINRYRSNNQFRHQRGILQGNPVSTQNPGEPRLVDIESDLRGITRSFSLCPDKKYQPQLQCVNKKNTKDKKTSGKNGNCHCGYRKLKNCSCQDCIVYDDTHPAPNDKKQTIINFKPRSTYKFCDLNKGKLYCR